MMSFSKHGPLVAALAIVGVVLVATVNQQNQQVEMDQVRLTEVEPSIAAKRAVAVPSTLQAAPAARPQLDPMPAATWETAPEGEGRLAAARISELDQKLRTEPFDPAWARAQEEVISQAIVGRPNDGFDVPLPESLDASCRSTLCRIQMTYADEEHAMQMQTKLTLGLSGAIATARTFYQPNEKGSMDLIVFAGAVD